MRIKIERSENIFYHPQERFHNQTPILNVFKYKFTQKFHKLKKKQFFFDFPTSPNIHTAHVCRTLMIII